MSSAEFSSSPEYRCLDAVHEMRAMAHIVDMHQLTNDVERLTDPESDMPHAPRDTAIAGRDGWAATPRN